MKLKEGLKYYNEDIVLDQLIDDAFKSGFSDFIGIGERGRAKKEAKLKLKKDIKDQFGKKWFLPKNYKKFREEYKLKVGDAVTKAVDEVKEKRFLEREEKKEVKDERKDERADERANTEFNQSLEQQKQIDAINEQKLKEAVEKIEIPPVPVKEQEKTTVEKKPKTTLFVGIGFVVLIVVVVIIIVSRKKRK
jgi:hypothetical protein